MTETPKKCRWCGEPFTRREEEPRSAFRRRRHCSRSCQVSSQNSDRARENRYLAQAGEES